MQQKNLEIKSLVEQFVHHENGQRINAGDVDTCNKHAHLQGKVFEKLVRDYGEAGVEGLASLLDDENLSVRLSAAVFLLRRRHEEAMAVLWELAPRKELGLISFGAKCSIRNWYTGDWEIDPGPMSPEMSSEIEKYRGLPMSEIPYGDWENP